MTFDIAGSDVKVKLSHQPEIIDNDELTTFTFEFLSSTIGQHLKDVSYSVHIMLDGKSIVHGHEDIASSGVGIIEQKSLTL